MKKKLVESGVLSFDVYLISLDPTQGSEIRKRRPCVVIFLMK
jgi:mRNA interferase MazF